jgi:glycosyltransferase involved in cell wall biosynthesis
LAVNKQLRGKRIYYCHTTPRFALDRKYEYLEKFPYFIRPLIKFSIERYLKNYILCLQKMDLVLTNSEHIRNRLNIQLDLKSTVVYPPIKVDKYKWISQGDYYLSIGRLEKNKRVDLIVKAFINMPEKKLIVASGGSQFQYLKNLAIGAKNIFFTDWTSEEKLIELIGNSIACIYIPFDEDFGMSAVESMSAGKPVIGVAGGGMMETIIDGVTGNLLPHNPNIENICAAVRLINPPLALLMRNQCEMQANKFSEKNFIKSIESYI